MTDEIEALARELVPSRLKWWTGTGTVRSSAQILDPRHRNRSWYAVADSEAEALRLAAADMRADPDRGLPGRPRRKARAALNQEIE